MRMRIADRLTVPAAYHGEGPFWDAPNDRLLAMDVLRGDILAVNLSGSVRRYEVPSANVSVIRRRTLGGFTIATGHGLMGANDELTMFEPIAEITDDPNVRINDGGCDPTGSFVIGTMAHDERRNGGAVYRVAPDLKVSTIVDHVSISNGVQWSADSARVYYIDTPTRRIDVFDVNPDTGAWFSRRPHIHVDSAWGYPDGMAIDEEDGLWVALWGQGAVNHYDEAGRLVETITVPGVTQTSSCAFGGSGRDVLFITTSRQDLTDDQEPSAGALFAVQTGSRGAAVAEYAG